MADGVEGPWQKYQKRFGANVNMLEAMVARSDPRHLPLDEQDARRSLMNAVKQRFDELAGEEYLQWVDNGLPYQTYSTKLSELRAQVLAAQRNFGVSGQTFSNGGMKRLAYRPRRVNSAEK